MPGRHAAGAGALSVGVLGLGRMGLPIAARLARAGFVVSGFDIDDSRRRPAELVALSWAANADELAAGCDILVTVLPGPAEVKAAASRAFAHLAPKTCWIDLTSTDPRVATRLAALAAERSIASVAAPMGGGVEAAAAGRLTFFVSGAAGAVERAAPVLEVLGGAIGRAAGIRSLGDDIAAGPTAKLLANLLWFGQSVAVTEALLLGQALGLDLATLRDTLAASAGGSAFIDRHLDHLLAGDYLTSFGLDRCVEELDTVAELAGGAGVPFELSTLVGRMHRDALHEFGAVDGELLAAKLLERRAGRTLRSAPTTSAPAASAPAARPAPTVPTPRVKD
ncbi:MULTISPECIES: NAD(P)-dependent oxidoreductase [Subtercola]|uniref:NAD(P)-dependent oxidoreductase n=1 Tax=Subtercola vilae TaxID=2056433 RepID=A0A4T2CCI1_9MICO|nr:MULTISPECIES: NAD(P)-binding domain-containing protein [Subtercola]MEA9986445.1 NAD(P)-binding domain-containing protein [Subtercola sp. RTI3]TIH40376.1 NAD(P)-dependent oxidoreductase [Subtercola vilae]